MENSVSGNPTPKAPFKERFSNWCAHIKEVFEEKMQKYHDYPKPLRKNKYKFITCMLIISIVSWAIFYVYKNFSSIMMAFQTFKGYGEGGEEIYEWGFGNFELFWQEMTTAQETTATFKNALMNTLFIYVMGNVVAIPAELIFSYYLYKKVCGYKIFRNIFYVPNILSAVVMTTIFKNIVTANGLISSISLAFGGSAVTGLLTSPQYAKWTVLFYLYWIGLPGSYILLTAAMNRIPQSVIESAKLDGVKPFGEFIHIIVPMIWPTLYILILQKITSILSADGPILLLTNGESDTYTIGFWFYMQVIMSHKYEYPSAIGLLMTLVVAPISIIARKLLDKVYADVEY